MIVTMQFGVTADRIAKAVDAVNLTAKAQAVFSTLKAVQVDLFVNEDGLVTGGNIRDTSQNSPGQVANKPAPTVEAVLTAYMRTNDEEIPELKRQIKHLETLQENRTKWVEAQLQKQGVDSFKKVGVATAFFTSKDAATVTDREKFFTWILETKNTHFLPMKVIKAEVVHMLDEEKQLPPGVEYKTFKEIVIKRS